MNLEEIKKEIASTKTAILGLKQKLDKLLLEEENLTRLSLEPTKKELLRIGLECRSGHKTGSTNHREFQSDNGEYWTFVVVHKDRPAIECISERYRGISVSPNHFNPNWILGNGETEDEAWDLACENWIDDEQFRTDAIS